MTLLEQLEEKVILERLVIGLEEPVLIKGLGELQAKIDSGNGGYNVIHGTDFHQQGEELMFTTHDSNGNEKRIQAKVIDSIQINMGGGNIEERPVIELDIKFAGEDYKKIPFSVSDRSTNTNPILISKGFVQDELQALIDVGATNISNDGIDVVYGESIMTQGMIDTAKAIYNAPKKVAQGVKKAADATGVSDVLGGVKKGLGRFMKNPLTALDDWLSGKTGLFSPLTNALGAAKDVATGAVKGGLKAGMSGMAGLGALTVGGISGVLSAVAFAKWLKKWMNDKTKKDTKKTILAKLKSSNSASLLKNQGVDLSNTLWQNFKSIDYEKMDCYLICDCTGKKGNGEVLSKQVVEALKKGSKSASEAVKKQKQGKGDKNQLPKQNNQPQQQQQELLAQAISLLQYNELAQMAVANNSSTQSKPTSTQPTQPVTKSNNASPTENNKQEVKHMVSGVQDDELQTKGLQDNIDNLNKSVQRLNSFSLWFIPMTKDYKESTSQSESSKKVFQLYFYKGTFSNVLKKLYTINKVDASSVTPIIKIISDQFKKKYKKDYEANTPATTNEQQEEQIFIQSLGQYVQNGIDVARGLYHHAKGLKAARDAKKDIKTSKNDLDGIFALVTGADNPQVQLFDTVQCMIYNDSKVTGQKKNLDNIKKNLKEIIDYDDIFDTNIATSMIDDIIQGGNETNLIKFANSIFGENCNLSKFISNYKKFINSNEQERNKLIEKYKNQFPMFLFYYNLLQSDAGKNIYQILKNKDFPIFKDANAIIEYVTNNKQILQILNPQSKQEQQEEWIVSKLQQFRTKGII